MTARLTILLLLTLLPVVVHAAEEPTAPPEEKAAEPAPAPEAIPLAQIAREADALSKAADDLTERFAATVQKEAKAVLADIEREISSRHRGAGSLTGATAADLQSRSSYWTALDGELRDLEDRLSRRIDANDQEIAKLDAQTERWALTSQAAGAADTDAPAATLQTVQQALERIKDVRAGLQKWRNGLIDLQTQAGLSRTQVREELQRVEKGRKAVLGSLLERQEPPLWQLGLDENYQERLSALQHSSANSLHVVYAYVDRYRGAVALHLLIFFLILWAVRRACTALHVAEEETLAGSRRVLQHSFAAALTLSLVATPLLHSSAPIEFRVALSVAALPAFLVVVRPILPQGLHGPVWALAVLVLLDIAREALTALRLADRLLLLVEVGIALAGAWWLRRPTRLALLPARMRGATTLRLASAWLSFSVLALGVSFAASVFGYTTLASLLAMGVVRSTYIAAILVVATQIADGLFEALAETGQLDRVRMVRRARPAFLRFVHRVTVVGGALIWASTTLSFFAVREPTLAGLGSLLEATIGYGPIQFSIAELMAFGVTLWLSWILARFLSFFLEEEVFSRVALPRGIPLALATFSRYVVIVIGFTAAMAMVGFSVDRIALLISALGVGIGFGLQNVVNNFVSGAILLFERPVRVGDRVQLDDLLGEITRIGIRASRLRTFDGADVIVPNGDFIAARVINWTLSDSRRRIILPIGVAYGSNPSRVLEVLEEVIKGSPNVLSDPEPQVLFRGFGDSSLDFELRIWTESEPGWLIVQSDLGVAVTDALREAGIQIPFPQRDLHLRTVSEGARAALDPGSTSER